MNRDDYPLKPVSIAYDNKKKEIFLLNIALKTQRSIEIYELKNKSLIYKNRFRSPKFKNLISITIFKDQMVGLNYNGFSIFFWRKGVLFIKKDSKGFEYILEKARYATKLKAINDKLFVVVPKEKKILMFDENFNFYRQLNFDEYPLDIEFFMDNYLISLSKKYLNVFEGLEVDEIKSLDTYFYIISRNDLDYKESFRKNESFIKKLKLRNFYSHSFFSYQSMKLNLFLHHYSLSSIICEI
ncbi:MAG: hypothetical protein NZ853_00945 [Leptospiraceae bacterium]|nr:hypothetical protein [Leptospiraceae bacterium]